MKKVLITGPIASGKSVVRDYLRNKGFSVYDSDSRAKALYDEIPGLKERIEKTLDLPFSQLNVIFFDENRRRILQNIVFPLVLEDMKGWASSLDENVLFFESAIAADDPVFDGFFDEVWVVHAPLQTRASRNEKVLRRDALQQLPAKYTVMIENDGTIDELKKKIDNLL